MARPAALMAAGTIASRVTGLLRVIAMGVALGISGSRLADTFNVANTLPNIVYELILGGVLTSVFIPLVVDALRQDDGELVVGTLVGTTLAVLVVSSLALSVAAPLVVRIFTFRGGATSAEQTALAAFFFRFFAFQVLFYGMTAVYGGLLNARGRFGVPAFAPTANNVIAIATFLAFAAVAHDRGLAVSTANRLLLGIGTTAAVAATALLHVFPVRKVYGRLPLRISLSAPIVRRLLRLSGWTLVYVLTTQAEATLAVVLAYGKQGGATAFAIAFSFAQLPVGVLAISVMTVVVPALAERASAGDMAGYRVQLERATSLTLALVVPAAFAYVVLAPSVVAVLIERGRVSAADAAYVGRLVQILTVSLPAYSLWLLFLRGFYALQDTRTPARINFVEVGAFCVLDLALYPLLKVEGLAWAHTLGYILGAGLAGAALSRRVGGLRWRRVAGQAGRVTAAGAAGAAVMWGVLRAVEGHMPGLAGRAEAALAAGAAGLLVFAMAAALLGVDDYRRLRELVPRRPGRGTAHPG
jgi:putative peptidoglycan lipid II flippase